MSDQGGPERVRLQHVGPADLTAHLLEVGGGLRATSQRPHVLALSTQPRAEPSTDVAGSPGNRDHS